MRYHVRLALSAVAVFKESQQKRGTSRRSALTTPTTASQYTQVQNVPVKQHGHTDSHDILRYVCRSGSSVRTFTISCLNFYWIFPIKTPCFSSRLKVLIRKHYYTLSFKKAKVKCVFKKNQNKEPSDRSFRLSLRRQVCALRPPATTAWALRAHRLPGFAAAIALRERCRGRCRDEFQPGTYAGLLASVAF